MEKYLDTMFPPDLVRVPLDVGPRADVKYLSTICPVVSKRRESIWMNGDGIC
jgi:hypothetical protein